MDAKSFAQRIKDKMKKVFYTYYNHKDAKIVKILKIENLFF